MKRAVRLLLALAALAPERASAELVITNTDGANEGLNDPTPVAPVGGNTATTLGAQRLRVLETAVQAWNVALSIPIDVEVDASFDALPCSAATAVLGLGGAVEVVSDFAGAVPNTWYPIALGNQIAGTDLNGATAELELQMSSALGTASCFA